jgi:hypothetical protein
MAEKDIDIRFNTISDPAIKEIGKVKSEIVSLGVAILGLKSFKDAVMDVGKFNDSLMRTKFSANLTSTELVKLKDSLYSAALQTGNTSESMLKMGQDALTASKDVDFVNKNLKLMGQISSVVGSEEGVGKFLSEIHEKTKLSGKALQDFAFELISFSQQKGVKISSKDLISGGGDLIEQLYKAMPGASSSQYKTAVEQATFIGFQTYMSAQKKIARLIGAQRSFINPQGREGPLGAMGFSEKQAITVADVIGRAMKMAGGDAKKAQNILSAVFKGQSLDISRLIIDYGKYTEAQKKADPSKVATQAEEASVSFDAAMNDMHTAGKLFAQTELAKPIEELSKWITNFTKNTNADQMKVWMKEVRDLALEIGVAFAAWKIFKFGQGIARAFGKGGKGGVGIGQLGTMTNPMYVIQVGSSGESLPGMGGGLGGIGGLVRTGGPIAAAIVTGIVLGVGTGKLIEAGKERYDNPTAEIEKGLSRPFESVGGAMAPSSILHNNFTVNANLVANGINIPVKTAGVTVSKDGQQAVIR